MASSEKTSSRSGLGWFPKLFLWTAVIAFGYVYLNSVDRDGIRNTASSILDSIAKLSPIPISALPGSSHEQKTAEAGAEVAKGVEAPRDAGRKPVNEAESAVFAKSLVKDDAVAAKPVETPVVEMPTAAPVQPPAKYETAAAKPAVEPVAAPVQPVSVPTGAAVAQAQAAPVTPPQVAPAVAAAQGSPAAQGAPGGWESMEQQRAEMQARYEAMRRESDERMRAYWARMRESMPAVAGPFGYPGYGYAPGVYAPPR